MSAAKRSNKGGPQSRDSDEEDLEEDVPEVQDLPAYTENVTNPDTKAMSQPSTSQRVKKQFRESYGPGPNSSQTIPTGLRKKIKEEKGKRARGRVLYNGVRVLPSKSDRDAKTGLFSKFCSMALHHYVA